MHFHFFSIVDKETLQKDKTYIYRVLKLFFFKLSVKKEGLYMGHHPKYIDARLFDHRHIKFTRLTPSTRNLPHDLCQWVSLLYRGSKDIHTHPARRDGVFGKSNRNQIPPKQTPGIILPFSFGRQPKTSPWSKSLSRGLHEPCVKKKEKK